MISYIALVLAFIAGSFLTAIYFRSEKKGMSKKLDESEEKFRSLDKVRYEIEASKLRDRNDSDAKHHDEIKLVRASSYKEGLEDGKVSCQKDHQMDVININSRHKDEIAKARVEAESEGRRIAAIEHESRVKAFSISIHPYVRIEKDEGIIVDDYRCEMGYQYQLLVNGVPAFQPHVVVEQIEEHKKVDKEMVKEFANMAAKLAKEAVDSYLTGVSGTAVKVGGEIVRNVKK